MSCCPEQHRQAMRCVDIVIDDKDTEYSLERFLNQHVGIRCFDLATIAALEPHDKFATFSEHTERFDSASVQRHESLHEAKTNSKAALRAIKRPICLREKFEY